MNRDEFLSEMDQILGLPAGTIRGDEKLEDLENWDSMALITLIALAESSNNARLLPSDVAVCSTVADLIRLANVEVIAS